MGAAVGKMVWLGIRPFKNYNVENRAQRVIAASKPKPAPKHNVDLDALIKESSDAFKATLKKEPILNENLRQVYVTSQFDNVQIKNKLLPQDRERSEQFEYGFPEPKIVPKGKASLKQILEMITEHSINNQVNSAPKLATKYHLDEIDTDNVLKYFKVLEVYIPEDRAPKAKFAGPTLKRYKITPVRRKEIPAAEAATAGKSD